MFLLLLTIHTTTQVKQPKALRLQLRMLPVALLLRVVDISNRAMVVAKLNTVASHTEALVLNGVALVPSTEAILLKVTAILHSLVMATLLKGISKCHHSQCLRSSNTAVDSAELVAWHSALVPVCWVV